MIPKSCRLFGQDHATKQVIRTKWRFALIPFRSNAKMSCLAQQVPALLRCPIRLTRLMPQRCLERVQLLEPLACLVAGDVGLRVVHILLGILDVLVEGGGIDLGSGRGLFREYGEAGRTDLGEAAAYHDALRRAV